MATVYGTEYADNLYGTTYMGVHNQDTIFGYGGDDVIDGGGGSDVIWGGEGDDIIFGDGSTMDLYVSGSDEIHGGAGNDVIVGGLLFDDLFGDEGNDTFINYGVGTGNYNGGADTDAILLAPFNGIDPGYPGAYTILKVSGITGVESIVNGTSLTAYIDLVGNDNPFDFGGAVAQDFVSIRGDDTAQSIVAPIFYNLSTATYSGAVVNAGGGDDTITGSSLGDQLNGGTGNDILHGAGGVNHLTGGTGTDYFWFENAGSIDYVKDYVDGTDKIVVGSSLASLSLAYYDLNSDSVADSTLLTFINNDSSVGAYAILENVLPTVIDASDLLWA